MNKFPYIMLSLLGVVIILIFWTGSAMISQYFGEHKTDTKTEYNTGSSKEILDEKYSEPLQSLDVNLTINPLEDYNFMSKKDIYRIRKKYVASSLFASDDYEPNEAVFGQIENGKRWWGLNQIICSQGDDTASGISAMSRFINNPNMLIATFFARNYTKSPDMEWYCNADFPKFIPYELSYNKKQNLITAKYKLHRIAIENKHDQTLIGMNARDFGYNYIYIEKLSNINMVIENNASKEPYQFRDFVHTGGSCGLPGGCNNISPRQMELEYIITEFPAEMNIKLWKNKPMSSFVRADFNYKIIFDEV